MRRKVVAGITLLGIAAVADLIWVKTRSHAPISAAAGLTGAAGEPAVVPAPEAAPDHGSGSGSSSCGDRTSHAGSPSSSYAVTRKSATCK